MKTDAWLILIFIILFMIFLFFRMKLKRNSQKESKKVSYSDMISKTVLIIICILMILGGVLRFWFKYF